MIRKAPPIPSRYLRFTALADNSTIALNGTTTSYFEVSVNGGSWRQYQITSNVGEVITLDTDDYVEFRRVSGQSTTSIYHYAFAYTGTIKGEGYVTSLLDREIDVTSLANNSLRAVFIEGMNCQLNLPSTLVTIGNAVFFSDKGLTGDLVIPDSVTSLGSSAFYDCKGFTGNLNLPDSLTTIGNEAFSGCSNLNGTLKLPSTITTIGTNTFYNCQFTGLLTIPSTVVTIGNNAFQNCTGFTGDLTLPEGMTMIGTESFASMTSLNGVLTLPSTITSIGDYAFRYDSGLTAIKVLATTPPTIGTGIFNSVTCNIYVPYSSDHSVLTAYQNDSNWSAFTSRLYELTQDGLIS